MTMHSAKGLEFRAVAIIGCGKGLVPLGKAVREAHDEDERAEVLRRELNLLYVAMTRPRDFLHVTWVGEPSPFLAPLLDRVTRST